MISLVLVTDSIGFQGSFNFEPFDLSKPYKTHYTVVRDGSEIIFSKHHRREITLAKQTCETKIIPFEHHLDDWIYLYETLVSRHKLSGIHLFSKEYFASLAGNENFTTTAAFVDGKMVSAHIWLKYQDRIYSHLAASNEAGYAHRASYVLYDFAISHFSQSRIFDLGGSPDRARSASGLSSFKKGFSNQTRSNRICGVIAEPEIYQSTCLQHPIKGSSEYFPQYRSV